MTRNDDPSLLPATPQLIEVADPQMRALLSRYLARRREDVQALRDALENTDFGTIGSAAHRMHGSGGSYGLPQISQIGEGLERAAAAGDADAVRDELEALEALLAVLEVTAPGASAR